MKFKKNNSERNLKAEQVNPSLPVRHLPRSSKLLQPFGWRLIREINTEERINKVEVEKANGNRYIFQLPLISTLATKFSDTDAEFLGWINALSNLPTGKDKYEPVSELWQRD